MELPHLGKHCSNPWCKQLDFLPMTCDACSKIFCKDHIQYDTHSCTESYRKNNVVPVCPLCNIPCPVKKGESADEVVSRHVDSNCLSNPAMERGKIYTNKCSVKSCKQKELVPMTCNKCLKNFCIPHRNEMDHDCKGFENTGRQVSRAGAAALFRFNQAETSKRKSTAAPKTGPPQSTTLSGLGKQLDQERRNRQAGTSRSHEDIIPGHMTEEEALNLAMQASMQLNEAQATSGQQSQQELDDQVLAQVLAASEEEERQRAARARRPTNARQEKSSCQLS